MWQSGEEIGEEEKPESPFAVLSALKKEKLNLVLGVSNVFSKK
jgi:hypothetical protein